MASPRTSQKIHFRSLKALDEDESDVSPHFLSALQIIAHVLAPLRKGLVHFCLMYKSRNLEKVEWRTIRAIGSLLKELTSAPPNGASSTGSGATMEDEDRGDDDDENFPIDPTSLYKVLQECLAHFSKPLKPNDAAEALQILLYIIQKCCRTLPVTAQLWSALLDSAGLGLVAKQVIVGKSALEEDGEILQRTRKESMIEWCPLVLKRQDTLEASLQAHCAKISYTYEFDKDPYDFEVRIPLLAPLSTHDTNWTTTKSIQWSSLTTYLFLAIDRLDADGKFDASHMDIPNKLNVSKICDKACKTSTDYELVGGILYDEEDYVAVLRDLNVQDPNNDEAWKLMESEEVIPMSQVDIFDFLQGEGDGSPCGTVFVYRLKDEEQHKELNQILSDIIIAHVSGKVESKTEYYYEEEVVDDDEGEDDD